MGISSAWHATPWMVRAASITLVGLVLLIVMLRVTKELVRAKKTFEAEPPTLGETAQQVSVQYIYNYVDQLIRAGKTTAENSQKAKEAGRDAEASAFAFASLAYLQSAKSLAPKRVAQILPNLDEMIDILNKFPSRAMQAKLGDIVQLQ